MSAALIVLGGFVFIALSIVFRFTPRLRVVVGLIVGGLLAGWVLQMVTTWLGKGSGMLAGPLASFIGQPSGAVAAAIPTAVAFGLAIVVVVFLRGKGGKGGKGAGGGKAGKGGGGGKAGLAHAALVCAILLPMIALSVREAVRSVAS